MAPPVDESCIFCKIVQGKIPCFKVFEDEAVLAFLDVGPLVRGHTLVIPKGHYGNLMEAPGGVAAGIGQRLPRLARAVLAATGAQACHVLVNNGAEALQSVRHLHYHILPRGAGDGFAIPWNAGKLQQGEGGKLAASIREELGVQA